MSAVAVSSRDSIGDFRLTGDWQVRPIPLDSTDAPEHIADAAWIDVPECAHLQPILYPERPYWGEHLRAINQQVWVYRRHLTIPEIPYRRARLLFEGIDYFASVWLNDAYVGQHEGGFVPFTLDISQHLHPDADNVLLVRVSSPWDTPNPRGTYPTDHVVRGLVKGLYEHGDGVIPPDANPIGIWRPVRLLLDDGISIDHVRIRTALDGRVALRLTVTNATGMNWKGALNLRISPDNHDSPGVTVQQAVSLMAGTQTLEYALTVAEPRWWWPWDQGDPYLYRLDATLQGGDGGVSSVYDARFGIRSVRLERSAKRFAYSVNDREVFIRGTSYIPALYLSQCSRDTLRQDIAFARDAHLNLIRAHIHVSPPEFYDLCDETGMMVWQDFELNWAQDTSIAFEKRARALQHNMIDLLGNHPAIITWACHNEPTMVFTRRHNLERHPDPLLYADAVQQDPTRPVFICSGQLEDDWRRAGDVHSYYGALWTSDYTDIYRHRFRLNSEFGFEAPASLATLQIYADPWERLQHLTGEIDELWAYQAELIRFQVEHLRRLRADGCAGYIHFWLADLVPQVGCGVLDAFRQPKGGYAALQSASEPLHVAMEHDGRRPYSIWVFNDTPHTYPNAIIDYQAYGDAQQLLSAGKHRCDIVANASQRAVDISGTFAPALCKRITLSVHDRDGQLLAQTSYATPFQPRRRPPGYPWKFNRYLGTKVFDQPGATSIAELSESPLFRLVPLSVREATAEWVLRQQLPTWMVSSLSRLIDRVLC